MIMCMIIIIILKMTIIIILKMTIVTFHDNIQLSPEGEVNSGGYTVYRDAKH